jgi:hypothetical protein
MQNRTFSPGRRTVRVIAVAFGMLCGFVASAAAQTDCAEGDGVLDSTPLKNTTPEEIIRRFTAEESKVKEARSHYTFTQSVLVQTLNGKAASGQFHEISQISYDDKGKRQEKVTFAEQSTLQGVQLSAEDMNDVRVFMPWTLPAEDLPQYKVTYAGEQHVDDLDTYVFHIEPKTEEKDRRYFQGRAWVDSRDLQIVKVCGKSVPDVVHVKKHQPMDIRPMFVAYRQIVDGHWFPAYAKVDDTLHFGTQDIHIREIVKFTEYKGAGVAAAGSKP